MLSQHFCKYVVLASFVLVCCGASTALADKNMEKAMTAAFGSKEVKKLKIKGHEFNVKPVKTEKTSSGVKVTGQISHCLTWQDDDQVYYSFTIKADGTVESFDVNIEKSLMHRALVFVWDELKDAIRKELTDSDQTGSTKQGLSLSNELAELEKAIQLAESKIGTGGWQKAAASIVANVMIRSKPTATGRVYDRVGYLRGAVARAKARASRNTTKVVRGTTLNTGSSRPNVRDHRNR